MLFSEVLAAMTPAPDAEGAWDVNVPRDWLQGRSVFGGMQGAIGVRAMRALAGDHPLRVVQTTFIAPMPEGASRVETRLLRKGKTTIHAESRIVSGGETVAIAVAVFGKSRPSAIAVSPTPHALDSAPLPSAPLIPPMLTFLQHFDMRWLRGGPPGSSWPHHDTIVQVGLHDSAPASEAHVLAIADATPPVALSMLSAYAPASSLTWTLEMLREGDFAALPLAGWRLDVEITAGASGYTSQSEMVWGPGGEAIAVSRQSMVIFG